MRFPCWYGGPGPRVGTASLAYGAPPPPVQVRRSIAGKDYAPRPVRSARPHCATRPTPPRPTGARVTGSTTLVRELAQRAEEPLDGDLPVDMSGGVLSTNPIGASGMIRFAEAALQVRGRAGEQQVDGARRVLGHA